MGEQRTLVAELESTDFDTSDLLILGFRAKERISELFSLEIDVAIAASHTLPESASPGANITLSLQIDDGEQVEHRRIHGILHSIRDRLDATTNHRTYLLRVVPELARMCLVETQEVYLGRTVPEIIRQKLDMHEQAGPAQLTIHADDYPKREFVVQYKESDLAFVSRLAEHLGISFVFEHGDQAPARVIFTDDVGARGLVDGLEMLPYQGSGAGGGVFALEVERTMFPSFYSVQDYNYRTPLAEITGAYQPQGRSTPVGNGGGVIEYGAHHTDKDQGDKLAKIRAEERLSGQEVFVGKSSLIGVTAGATPKLTGHPAAPDQRLLIVAVEHEATFIVEGATAKGKARYENTFHAISADIHYRPPRVTPRPRIHGLLTGNVALGANGQVGGRAQIDADGRYLVQFHFDTVTHTGEENASHPIRMATPFAGPNHGFHFPLRPGAEVVLAFLDGDPDRPIIIGSVPNGIAPSASVAKNSNENRIQSATGIVIQFAENK